MGGQKSHFGLRTRSLNEIAIYSSFGTLSHGFGKAFESFQRILVFDFWVSELSISRSAKQGKISGSHWWSLSVW